MPYKTKDLDISLKEAVETLSQIADLEFDTEDDPAFFSMPRNIQWLQEKDNGTTCKIIKETFRVILEHLRNYYKEEIYIVDQSKVERVKAIMLLVGEAAKKFDTFTMLFHKKKGKSITEFGEYKRLQEFYLRRIARRIDEGILGKWILALSQKVLFLHDEEKQEKNQSQVDHVFVDLEAVKKDTEYELFLLKKEDGGRFFNPRLIRNIKLVSDFGDNLEKNRGDDPLTSLAIWQDRYAHECALDIIKFCKIEIGEFYHQAKKNKENKLIDATNKVIMALMLAGNAGNLMHNSPIKTCRDYFTDFLCFLRLSLCSQEYQQTILLSEEKDTNEAVKISHLLCFAIFAEMRGMKTLQSIIHNLLHEAQSLQSNEHIRAAQLAKTNWSHISCKYTGMTKLLKLHPNGPLNKIMHTLENSLANLFDPLFQENLPCRLFSLFIQDNSNSFIHMPSPTIQEVIGKANIDEIFKGFLRAANSKILYFNLQDRTSWRDRARCICLEDLAKQKSVRDHFFLVTLSMDTEFYHQLPPYHQESRAEVFIRNFKTNLNNEKYGYGIPASMRKILDAGFINEMMDTIHRIFFGHKNTLSVEQRKCFIEIFTLFLELKIIEIVQPNMTAFVCKDGIDLSGTASAQLFLFIKLINQEVLSENDQELIDLILYGFPLLIRERLLLHERFNRMLSTIKLIESFRTQYGVNDFIKIVQEAFGRFYSSSILQAKAIPSIH